MNNRGKAIVLLLGVEVLLLIFVMFGSGNDNDTGRYQTTAQRLGVWRMDAAVVKTWGLEHMR